MKLKARLIKDECPTLLIKKNPELNVNTIYRITFINNKKNEILEKQLKNFNSDYLCFKFVNKVMGAFGLKYQQDYEIEVNEVK